MESKKYIGILLLVLMLLSTFAFTFIQGGFHQTVEVPTGNIVKQLSPEQEAKLIAEGKTIVIFTRSEGCEQCQEIGIFLEDVATAYKDQLVLVEKEADTSSILIKSAYGQRMVGVTSKERLTGIICDLMIKPPPTCVSGEL